MKKSTEQESDLPLARRAAHLALQGNTDLEFGEHCVTADQLVLSLARSEDEALAQREMADRITSDPSTVRAMLALLAKERHVEWGCLPADPRTETVSRTSAARRWLRKVGQSIRDDLHERVTPDEEETLIALLRRIACALTQERSLV